MFLVLPFVLCFLRSRLADREEVLTCFRGKELHLSTWPLRIMSFVCVCVLCFQGVTFGNTFVFRDDAPRDGVVTTLPTLKHMKTNKTNAQSLEELGAFASQENLSGKSVLLFGDIPALSAYLKMPFVMSPWPGLPSYTCEIFELELQKLMEGLEEDRPVIIFSSKFYNFLTSLEENVRETDYFKTNDGFKLTLLREMIQENNYKVTFENEGYVIFE
jgi:hypothetical protein